MTLSLAFNTTDAPVLVDEAGYVIDGKGWGPVDTADPLGKAELDAGRLVPVTEKSLLAAKDNPAAQAAIAALDERRDRLEAARAQSKQELAEALPDEVLDALPVGGDGLPAKDDLVDATAALPEAEDDTTTPKPRRGARQQ